MKNLSKSQIIFLLGALFVSTSLAFAYYLEFIHHMVPCSLCIIQRIAFWILAIVFLMGLVHNPKTWVSYIYIFSILVISALGGLAAGREIWLEHLPPSETPTSCMASIEQLFQYYPFVEAVKMLIDSPSECGVVDYALWGIPTSVLSLSGFMVTGLLGMFLWFFQHKKEKRT